MNDTDSSDFIYLCNTLVHTCFVSVSTEGSDGTSDSVIPNSVPIDSFSDPLGEADDFTINWQPVTVAHGQVYYRIRYSSQEASKLLVPHLMFQNSGTTYNVHINGPFM